MGKAGKKLISSAKELRDSIIYDPDFVASILKAQAAPPEAKFDNVEDAIAWLNSPDRK